MLGREKRKLIASLLFAGFLTLATTARQAYGDTFEMTWTGGYGPGSAVLTATPDGGGVFTVTGMSFGLQDGLAISLLPMNGYGDNDNAIYQSPNTDLVDFLGFGLTDGTNDYNIFLWTLPNETNTYTECSSADTTTGCTEDSDFNLSPAITTLSIVPVSSPTPEPSSWALFGIGMVLIFMQLRRKALRS
jgi:hypothetical protein